MQTGQPPALRGPFGRALSRVIRRYFGRRPPVNRRDPDTCGITNTPDVVRHSLTIGGRRREADRVSRKEIRRRRDCTIIVFDLTMDSNLRSSAALAPDVYKLSSR